MIGEILTAAFAAATGGYLWARARHYREVEKSKNRIKAMAGISQQTKNNNSDEPFWWQKGENFNVITSNGKLPETQAELDKYLEIQKQDLKADQHLYYLDQEKRKEREAERLKWEKGNAEYAKQMLATHKKKQEE